MKCYSANIAFEFLPTIGVKLLTHFPYNSDKFLRDGRLFRSFKPYDNGYNLQGVKQQLYLDGWPGFLESRGHTCRNEV